VNLSKRVAVAQSVGIDIGGTKTLALAVSSDGTIRSRRQHDTPQGEVEIAKLVVELYRELANSDLTIPLGIGVAGLVDRSGRLFNAPNLVAVDGFKIAAAELFISYAIAEFPKDEILAFVTCSNNSQP